VVGTYSSLVELELALRLVNAVLVGLLVFYCMIRTYREQTSIR
jgi:hypothetical protein